MPTRKKNRRNGKKTRKKMDPIKKKIKKFEKIFKQYPDVFPKGYFRYFEISMRNKIENKEIIFKNGVILTWKKYKKTPSGMYKKLKLKPGDIKVNQLVNKNQGNGMAKKVFISFLKKFKLHDIYLDVRLDNKKAIKFYKKNGFKKVTNTKFGNMKGIIMKINTLMGKATLVVTFMIVVGA